MKKHLRRNKTPATKKFLSFSLKSLKRRKTRSFIEFAKKPEPDFCKTRLLRFLKKKISKTFGISWKSIFLSQMMVPSESTMTSSYTSQLGCQASVNSSSLLQHSSNLSEMSTAESKSFLFSTMSFARWTYSKPESKSLCTMQPGTAICAKKTLRTISLS